MGEAGLEQESTAELRVGWGFISLYTLAYISTSQPGGRLARDPPGGAGTQCCRGARRLVHRPAAVQRPPGPPGGGAARPGPRVLLFAATLDDRRLAEADRSAWSLREVAGTLYVNPRTSPDFAWAFASRFLFVLAYAFLTTYQVYYLLEQTGSAEADVPHQIFLGTLVQSTVVVAASLVGGRLSDRSGRRKLFVLAASILYGLAMFVLAIASDFNGFLVGLAVGGLGFGVYVAVDLALGDRAGHPGGRRRQLRCAVRRRRGRGRHRRPRHPAREGCPMMPAYGF